MNTRNNDIRILARKAGVALWRVAERLGIADSTFLRRLRYQLTEEQRTEIVEAIKALEQEDSQ